MELQAVDQLRTELTAATTLAAESAAAYAEQVVNEAPEQVAAQLREAVPQLVTEYSAVAAESGALFYETQRPTYAPARIAAPSIGDALAADLSWAMVPVFNTDGFELPVLELVSRLSGIVQKHTAAGMRDTIMLSSSQDPDSYGVARYARSNACAFCKYLSAMEATVYEETVWHRNCYCVTVPWWEDNPLPEDPNRDTWAQAAEKARAELQRLQYETKPDGMRWRNFFKARPDLAMNTRNISRLMRAELGTGH